MLPARAAAATWPASRCPSSTTAAASAARSPAATSTAAAACPATTGTYFYGDFISGTLRSFRFQNGQATDPRDWSGTIGRDIGNISSFGQDAEGELYVVDYDGEVFRIVPAP